MHALYVFYNFHTCFPFDVFYTSLNCFHDVFHTPIIVIHCLYVSMSETNYTRFWGVRQLYVKN